jgi:hypothetical protein
MKYTIKVTPEIIAQTRANRSMSMSCPIATAITEELQEAVSVNGTSFHSFDDPNLKNQYQLPRHARVFVQDFDAGREVKPFEFTVEIPLNTFGRLKRVFWKYFGR